ncbi:MAG: primosomal protein N' [Aeromonas sp.]
MSCNLSLQLVRLALPVPLRRHFDYLAPAPLPALGVRVSVPFGRQTLVGLVVEHPSHSDVAYDKLKPIAAVLDTQPLLGNDVLALMQWGASYYQHPLGEVLPHALPTLLRKGERASYREVETWHCTAAGFGCDLAALKRSPKQQQALVQLRLGAASRSDLTALAVTAAVLKALEGKGWIERQQAALPPATNWAAQLHINEGLRLNQEQALAVATINSQRAHFGAYLLDGITGSGKTEVYLHLLAPVLAAGQQALILVPEIGLTPQTVQRFRRRFNVPVVMINSAMNERERLEAWLACRDGSAAILIGTRSAVFTPFARLGLVVLDEEHDNSFKQQEGFRYHARDLAVMRAHRAGIPIVLGSATPSLETVLNVRRGKYHHLTLNRRAGNAQTATQAILDIKGVRLQAGVSPQLEQLMSEQLRAGNQVLLFLNRRGYAPALLCHGCGWSAACPRCDAWFTWHQGARRLHCHHCDSTESVPHTCPACGGHELVGTGVGTEQLEQYLRQRFADYSLVRIDRDSTRRKGALADHLQAIKAGEHQILIGTQMLAKGHHFPDVTLVGLLDVDGALFSSDFRAAEHLAQLYTQVAGRAGRASKAGMVVLQTHHPEHALLQDLTQNGYRDFAQTALTEREQLGLPPFSHQALFRASSHQLSDVQHFLNRLAQLLAGAHFPLQVLGPLSLGMARKAGKYQQQLLLQSRARQPLAQLLPWAISELAHWPETRRVRWSIDIDPIELS